MTDLTLITNDTQTFVDMTATFSPREYASGIAGVFRRDPRSLTEQATFSGTVEDVAYYKNYENSWETNILKLEEDKILENATSKKKFSFDSNTTCTTNATRYSITHEMIAKENATFPDFLTFNSSTQKYEGRALEKEVYTEYAFILNSTWKTDPANSTLQTVIIGIAPYEESVTVAMAILTAQAAVMIGAS